MATHEDFGGEAVSVWGPHVYRTLEKLFFNKKFIAQVEALRKKVAIPIAGFDDRDDYFEYLDEHSGYKKLIEKKSSEMAREAKLPDIYSLWIKAFIGTDFECWEYLSPFQEGIIPGHGYALDSSNKEYIQFRVYKGAPQGGFIKFVRKYWFIVNGEFDARAKQAKFPHVRKTRVLRNRQILELHKQGLIDSVGNWKPREKPPKILNGVGQVERKKIITDEKRKEKILTRHKKSK
jgi:hypothetical protein